jgi:hypothetical protein
VAQRRPERRLSEVERSYNLAHPVKVSVTAVLRREVGVPTLTAPWLRH